MQDTKYNAAFITATNGVRQSGNAVLTAKVGGFSLTFNELVSNALTGYIH